MNIKQALNEQNVLVGELKELYNLIRSNNSTIAGNPKHYNVSELMIEADSKMLALVSLKCKIQAANALVRDKIYMLSELKTKAEYYKAIDTTEGKIANRYQTNENTDFYQVEFNIKVV